MIVQPRGLPRLQDLPPNTFFLDDSNTSLIKYTTPFTTSHNDTCAGGTCTLLRGATGSLEFNFTGTDAWLFGKPGGITRVFLDNQLNKVLDTSGLPNNGSALWAVTGLTQGVHTIKLGGVDGDGLNLLIDSFSVNGVVSTVGSTTTDTNYLSPGQLTPIIIGSLVGFFALVAVIGISVLVYVRRKKRRRISKSGIKLVKFDGAAASGGSRSSSRVGLLSGFGGLFSGRPSTEKRSQMDMASDGYGGRVSNSTDGGNPFLKSQYASMNSNTVPSAYSPPTSADPSVPLFAQPLSQSRARQLSFIPESTTASSYPSIPPPLPQRPPQPPLEQQRQQQLQQLRQLQLVNPPSGYTPKGESSDNEPEPERTPLMEAPPPGYQPHAQRPVHQDPTSQYHPPETFGPADYKITDLPARGVGDSKVAMASFSTVPTPATTGTMQIPQTYMPTPQTYAPSLQPPTRGARNTMPDAPKTPEGTPLPSFRTLETYSDKRAGPVPPPPRNAPFKIPQLSTGTSLKGPRPRGASNAQPIWDSVAEEMQGLGVKPPAVTGPSSMRPGDEEPESPIDPAVNVRSHWY